MQLVTEVASWKILRLKHRLRPTGDALPPALPHAQQQALWAQVANVRVVLTLVEHPTHLVHPELTVVALNPRLLNLIVVLALLRADQTRVEGLVMRKNRIVSTNGKEHMVQRQHHQVDPEVPWKVKIVETPMGKSVMMV